jgi:hypothetical protein
MVMTLQQITWEEGLSQQQDASLAHATVMALVERLRAPSSLQRRVYVLVPTPAPDLRGQARWVATAEQYGLVAPSLKVVPLAHGGCCFMLEDEALLERWLPAVFRGGPPEITLLALNCTEPCADGELIQSVLRDRAPLEAADRAGLHFDSGDLIERF